MSKIVFLALPFLILAASASSCYRMPSEDDYSLLPSTNNPEMTRQRAEPVMPQMPM